MRHPFQIDGRKGWQAEYKFADGSTRRKTFVDHSKACDWLEEQKRVDEAEQGPKFGGPSRITLGQCMGEYAGQFTIKKAGYKSEVDRINHYVTAVGLPRLRVRVDAQGKKTLETLPVKQSLPSAFQAHKDARMGARERTYALIGKLACKKVSSITADDIQTLMTVGHCDGWSDSTIQKEIALLKAVFNSAIRVWKWKGFENPCNGFKLGKSNSRFVVVTDEQMARLVDALAECDNPQFWPLVDLAIHTTLREGSLLSMTWSQTNLETRRAKVWAKGKWAWAQLPRRAVEILKAMPRDGGDQVFTMSPNAVTMAWEGVREKAGLHGLTFRDLRHVGATAYAKAGLSANALMHLLGHTTTRMAEVYVNLARSDVIRALDEVDDKVAPMTPTPPTSHAHGMRKHPRLRKPVVASNVYHLVKNDGRMRAVRPGEADEGIDLGPVPKREPARR